MSKPEQPFQFYTDRISHLNQETNKLSSTRSGISWARLAVIIVAIVAVVWLWPSGFGSILLALIPLFIIFGVLVAKTLKLDEQITHNRMLIKISAEELSGLQGLHSERFEGSIYLRKLENSGNDLDIFGPASLYPFISRAYTEKGRDRMAEWLTIVADRNTILNKQEAVKELRSQTLWRQQLQAYGMRTSVTSKGQEIIENWIESPEGKFQSPVWMVLRFLIPLLSFSICILYGFDKVTDSFFNVSILLILGFVLWIGRLIGIEYSHLSKIVKELDALGNLFHTIESGKFRSERLVEQQNLLSTNQTASQKIRQLKKILNRLDYRLNPIVYLPLSVFFFWDLQQVYSLEKWRRTMQGRIGNWYSAVAEFECLASLSTNSFNHPGWVIPDISDNWFTLQGKKMGHPLILPSKSVTNDLEMDGTGKFIMLTGSNMAGKSTFLRTLGTNMILAMAGGVVCAEKFMIPVVRVISSMRIMDNLEEETSTFYAELKKLKTILEAVQRHEKVFILLDEMLRGTNAIDRHTGSVALIRQLIRFDAVGIIASHDISLTELSEDYPGRIENFHFDSSVIDNEIIFDYRLKSGVCTSTNATLLMKKIGIQIDQEV